MALNSMDSVQDATQEVLWNVHQEDHPAHHHRIIVTKKENVNAEKLFQKENRENLNQKFALNVIKNYQKKNMVMEKDVINI